MLQDLDYGRLENEYRPVPPRDADAVLCFRGGDVLLHRDPDNRLTLPTEADFPEAELRYAFRLHGTGYYLLTGASEKAPFAYERVRGLRQTVSKEVCYAVLTGWHLHNWYQKNRLCGGYRMFFERYMEDLRRLAQEMIRK